MTNVYDGEVILGSYDVVEGALFFNAAPGKPLSPRQLALILETLLSL
jgi:hypothetical protein